MKTKFILITIIATIASIFVISCKKVDTSNETPQKNVKKSSMSALSRSAGDDSLFSFKEFIFSLNLLDKKTRFLQKKDNTNRVLVQYKRNGAENRVYKYILVETKEGSSSNTMYIISKTPIKSDFDLYSLEIKKNEVINFDRLKSGLTPYIMNGVQIDNKIYSLNTSISSILGKVASDCEQIVCIDSWIIIYWEQSGVIVTVIFDPVCGPNSFCHEGGSGGGGVITPTTPNNPNTNCDATAHYPEEQDFNNYIQMMTMQDITQTSESPYGTPIIGSYTWAVAEALFGSWRVEAITNYAFEKDRIINPGTNFFEYIFTFASFNTTEGYFVGSQAAISSTYTTRNATINQVFNNNTAHAYGYSRVMGTIEHKLEMPKREPFCVPLKMDATESVDNSTTFTPR